MATTVFLIPTVLYEGSTDCLPSYIAEAVKSCSHFFVENERTARRYLKLLWKDLVIDDVQWHPIKEVDAETMADFKEAVRTGSNIGIISEAGCPGVADPGQQLVQVAQQLNVTVKPLVGPSSILLALMASGMNGQQFQFVGYLPIDIGERAKKIKDLESESRQKKCTQIFIETPYRNDSLLEALTKTCRRTTQLCIAAELTSDNEFIKTKTVGDWKSALPHLHKKPVIFLLLSAD